MALPILHIFAAVLNSYILWYDQVYVNVPFEKGMDSYPFRSRVLFLTLWNFVLHAVYYWIAFANDIFGTNDVSPRHPPLIRKIKDMIFALAFPLGVYVSVAFWGVYAVDKDLIFPEPVEKAYPPWINHPLHTLVSIFITIEMLTSNITYPRRKLGLAIINVFIFSYLVFLFIVYGQTGKWVYPVLTHLNWPLRICFCLGSVAIGHIFYFLGESLNRNLNPPPKIKGKKSR
ncbi:androgen-induced gene 1 protein-like [Pieris brassicae]|uniref:androgen-induced gene 1 protein-like n=1 Tax=Pieris brassicae TaxID=7116 RepID=UPI001E65F642|nr:androgen-induced gene 1 protein-like [Pieris brassicae]